MPALQRVKARLSIPAPTPIAIPRSSSRTDDDNDGSRPIENNDGSRSIENDNGRIARDSDSGRFVRSSDSGRIAWDFDSGRTSRDSTYYYVHPALRFTVSSLSGILFGISLEKGRVFEPDVIRDQMLFKRFIMLKMFLAAAATGMVSFSLLRLTDKTMKALRRAIENFVPCLNKSSVLGVTMGAGLLGSGMTLAGSCPGNVLVQFGAGVSNVGYTLAGCMCGGFLYTLTFPLVSRMFPGKKNKVNFLHESMNTNYLKIALPLATVLFAVVGGIEYYFPWDSEVKVTPESVGLIRAESWPPYVAGILVGLLQIPIVLANQDTLGSSTSYITIGSQILVIKPLRKILAYMKSYRQGWSNWWQVLFVGGAVLGSFLSSQASSTWASVEGVPKWHAFGGGLMMIYGSRLACGCTSGHGLSGMGLLALLSFVAVPSMFKAGIGTAFTLQYFDVPGFQK